MGSVGVFSSTFLTLDNHFLLYNACDFGVNSFELVTMQKNGRGFSTYVFCLLYHPLSHFMNNGERFY